jgi:hypothetical protein
MPLTTSTLMKKK